MDWKLVAIHSGYRSVKMTEDVGLFVGMTLKAIRKNEVKGASIEEMKLMGTRLESKVGIITGARLGIGKAAPLLFAREGVSVAICDRGRTPENSQRVLKEA